MKSQRTKNYTEEQSKFLEENWSLMSSEEREELSKKWNRTRQSLSNRFSYIKQVKNEKSSVPKVKEKRSEEIKVTHINRDITPASIYIGGTRIEIPTRNLMINGIELSW